MNPLRFEFLKFTPTLDISRHAEASLLHMAEFLPFGSVVVARLSKLKRKYQCLIQINTPRARFIQETVDKNPFIAISQVSEKVRTEIQNWQVKRMDMNEENFWNFKEVKV